MTQRNLLAEIEEIFETEQATTLPAIRRMTEEYAVLKHRHAMLKADAAAVDARAKSIASELNWAIKAAGLRGPVNFDSGLSVSPVTKRWYKPTVDQDTLGVILDEHNLGSISRRSVNAQTLNAAIREYVEGGNELPPGLHQTEEPQVSVRGKESFIERRLDNG